MKIVFFGSSQFAVSPLKALLTTAHKISCVVTQPDKKKGRGLMLAQTPVKAVAEEAGLEIYQPGRINTREAIKFLKGQSPDLFIVVAYGQILSQGILDIPTTFSINAHGSLLPKYRGAAPINWAIINGDKKTGITIIKMSKEMDAGAMILKREVDIADDDTAITLEDKLSRIAAELLLEALHLIENNNYNLTLQDKLLKVSFAPKLKKIDGLINWNKSAQDIFNLIRGCLPWPGAFTYYKGKLLKIYKAGVTKTPCLAGRQARHPAWPAGRQDTLPGRQAGKTPGEIIQVSKEGIVVATAGDNLVIEELQIEGKRKMPVKEFIAGHKICAGEILGKK